IRETYLEALAELRQGDNRGEPRMMHARNQVYWQLGCLGVHSPRAELEKAAEHEAGVIPRVGAAISLGRLGWAEWIEEVALENLNSRKSSEARLAYWLTYM